MSLLLLLSKLNSSGMATHAAKHIRSSRDALLNGSGQKLPLTEACEGFLGLFFLRTSLMEYLPHQVLRPAGQLWVVAATVYSGGSLKNKRFQSYVAVPREAWEYPQLTETKQSFCQNAQFQTE